MANLIVTVIAIALVAVASLMGAYYGGAAFLQGAERANAASLVAQGQQMAGAWIVGRNQYVGAPWANTANLRMLTTFTLLSDLPAPPADASRRPFYGVFRSGNQRRYAVADLGPNAYGVCLRVETQNSDSPLHGMIENFNGGTFDFTQNGEPIAALEFLEQDVFLYERGYHMDRTAGWTGGTGFGGGTFALNSQAPTPALYSPGADCQPSKIDISGGTPAYGAARCDITPHDPFDGRYGCFALFSGAPNAYANGYTVSTDTEPMLFINAGDNMTFNTGAAAAGQFDDTAANCGAAVDVADANTICAEVPDGTEDMSFIFYYQLQ